MINPGLTGFLTDDDVQNVLTQELNLRQTLPGALGVGTSYVPPQDDHIFLNEVCEIGYGVVGSSIRCAYYANHPDRIPTALQWVHI